MLFQPSQISPSSFGSLGNGTVDVNNDLTVTWQVNGNSALTKFQISIYQNNAASTLVYTTGERTDNCPFYGTDYKGNVQFFSYTIPSGVLIGAGMVNGAEYKLIIKQWWSATDSVTQTSASVFITRATPTLSISNFINPVTTRTYSFIASYYQAQGDALNWVRWQLAFANDKDNPFYDNTIPGTAQLQLDYDGFFTGNTYAVRCRVQTVNGIEADTGWQEFNVTYSAETLTGFLTARKAKGHSANYIAWPDLYIIPGEATGNYTIDDGQISLPDGSNVQWHEINGSPMSLTDPWSSIWQGKIMNSNAALAKINGVADTLTLHKTATSPAGAWTSNSHGTQVLSGVTYGNGYWVAVGYGGALYYATDPTGTWTSNPQGVIYDVAYGNGYWVAVGYQGLLPRYSKVCYTTDPAGEWTTLLLGENYSLISVAYGNGYWVAVGSSGTLYYATDPTGTWTSNTQGSNRFECVAYGNGYWVATTNSSYVYYTTDPTGEWIQKYTGGPRSVAYENGYWVAVGYDGALYYATDPTGTWTSKQLGIDTLADVTYGNGYWVTVGYGGAMYYATDPTGTWTKISQVTEKTFLALAYGDGYWVVVGEEGTMFYKQTYSLISLTLNGTSFYTLQVDLLTTDMLTIILTPTAVYFKVVRNGVIYATYSSLISLTQFDINSVEIAGASVCDFLQIIRGPLTAQQISNIMTSITYEPEFDDTTFMMCDFSNGLNAGNIVTEGGTVIGFAIYRLNSKGEFMPIATLAGNQLMDFSARSQETYTYYAYAVSTGTLSEVPYISDQITSKYWNWTILECESDANGIYHVLAEYQFGLNVNSGAITNNNNPEILKNFTPYPLIQMDNSKYKSGILTSLIGSTVNGRYVDTVELENAIMALSVSTHTLFLKTRKGDLLKIKISAPISMTTMDNSAEQAITMALPWTEIGSAEGVSIICEPSDSFWPYGGE